MVGEALRRETTFHHHHQKAKKPSSATRTARLPPHTVQGAASMGVPVTEGIGFFEVASTRLVEVTSLVP